MAWVNILLLTLLFSVVFFRPRFNYDRLVLFLGILGIISLLRPGPYGPGDFQAHTALSMSLYDSLKAGIFPVRWADHLCGGYGCPLFVFSYQTPYYLISLFHQLGFSFITGTKLLLALTFVGSGIAMFSWARRRFGSLAGFSSTAFYLYCPYHLVAVNFKVTVGEAVSFALLPLLLYLTDKYFSKPSRKLQLLIIYLIALFILSHQAISLIGILFWLAYIFYYYRGIRVGLSLLLPAIGLTAFYWLPIFAYAKYIHQSQMIHISYPSFTGLLFSPYRFGLLFQGPNAQLTDTIGIPQILVVLLALVFLKKDRFFLAVFFITVYMTLKTSQPIWELLPILKNFQFSARFLFLTAFSTSALAGQLIQTLRSRYTPLIIFIIYLSVLITALNWGNRQTLPEVTDATIRQTLSSRGDFNFTPIADFPGWTPVDAKFVNTPLISFANITSLVCFLLLLFRCLLHLKK